MARRSATGLSRIVSSLVKLNKPAAATISTVAVPSAAGTPRTPLARGRVRVRSTRRSKDRSARSFRTTPALRMRNEPAAKTASKLQSGVPREASSSAHSVGSISRRVPDWFESRMRRASVDQCRLP